MDYTIEGALIDQGFGDLDRKEINSSLFREIEKRWLDETMNFLGRQRVTYAVLRRGILRHRIVVRILRCTAAAAAAAAIATEEEELGQTIFGFPLFNFCR